LCEHRTKRTVPLQKMRILHTADWHLGKSLEQISRLPEQIEFVDRLCEIADAEAVDLVLVAGDVFDTYNPPAAAEALFYDALERLNQQGKRPVIVIAGNHDHPERLCASSPLAYKDGIILLGYPGSDGSAYEIDSPYIKRRAGGPGWLSLHLTQCQEEIVLLTMPYPSEARLEALLTETADEALLQQAYDQRIKDVLAKLAENFRQDTVNVVVSHLFMLGGKTCDSERTLQVGGAMTVAAASMPANADYVALGHLHRPQAISGGPCPIYYAGSPLAYSFSEAGYSKAVYLVEANPGQPAEIKPVYLSCGKPLVRWRAEKGIAEAISWCEAGKDANAWVDLEIVTDRVLTLEEQKTLRTLHPGIINIRPVLKTAEFAETAAENRESKPLDALFRDYYRYRLGIDVPPEMMRVFLDIMNDAGEEAEFEGAEPVEAETGPDVVEPEAEVVQPGVVWTEAENEVAKELL
jgi:exonuclease SbcD